MTSRSYPPASSVEEAGLKISALGGGGLAVDVQAWEMGSAWLELEGARRCNLNGLSWSF